MDLNFFIGIVWSLVLVAWAARPEPKKVVKSTKSIKDRLFLIGASIMLIFSWLWYQNWWSIFFFILEIFVVISGTLMMLDTDDKIDTTILSISWISLIIRSLYLFEWYTTIIFIVWLIGIWLWYTFKMWSVRRELALVIWSILVALFSYLEPNRIFFRLNIFFALFSSYYLIKAIRSKKNMRK